MDQLEAIGLSFLTINKLETITTTQRPNNPLQFSGWAQINRYLSHCHYLLEIVDDVAPLLYF